MSTQTNPIRIDTVDDAMRIRDDLKRKGTRIHLVPTMGALHDGHAALISKAMEPANSQVKPDNSAILESNQLSQEQTKHTEQVVIVSIFVNPVQFNNPKDLISYPKPIEKDLEICRRLGVHYVFSPEVKDMYPYGHDEGVICTVQGNFLIQYQLEGMSRPGHFTGMLTVVNKLFNIIGPNEAFFGEKDYQQLLLVERMVQDLNMGIKIRPVATVREPDGLPLSSRNVRIQKNDRPAAVMMSEILIRIKNELEQRFENWLADITDDVNQYIDLRPLVKVFAKSIDQKISDGFIDNIDYIELRCAKDLGNIEYVSRTRSFDCEHNCVRITQLDKPNPLLCRLLAAVDIGGVRLLDNVEVILNQETNSSM